MKEKNISPVREKIFPLRREKFPSLTIFTGNKKTLQID